MMSIATYFGPGDATPAFRWSRQGTTSSLLIRQRLELHVTKFKCLAKFIPCSFHIGCDSNLDCSIVISKRSNVSARASKVIFFINDSYSNGCQYIIVAVYECSLTSHDLNLQLMHSGMKGKRNQKMPHNAPPPNSLASPPKEEAKITSCTCNVMQLGHHGSGVNF